jgi:hypothetical protein
MATVDSGKHRRPEPVTQARAGMPSSPAGLLEVPADAAGLATGDGPDWLGGAGPWPQWDGPPSLLHPDHPSAPVPRVRSEAAERAAEKEAAHLRAVLLSLSEQLSQMADYLAENLTSPGGAQAPAAAAKAAPVTVPGPAHHARPATRPARPLVTPTRPATRHARPATRPALPVRRDVRPVTKPARSTTRPSTGAQGRQARAARKMVALLAALATVGVVSGAAELVLHGGPFFIFRANGAGASETGPVENQGPGQPDSPGAHHVPAPPKHAK